MCLSVLNTCTRTTFAHLFLCAYARTRAAVSTNACVYVCLCCESLPPPSHTHTYAHTHIRTYTHTHTHTHTHTQQGCLAPSTLSDTSLMRVRAHTHTHDRSWCRETLAHMKQLSLQIIRLSCIRMRASERERESVAANFGPIWNSLGRVKKTKNLNITRLARGERLAR